MKNFKNHASNNILHRKSVEGIRSLYRSSDLYLASFLKARGLYLAGVERECEKLVFVFKVDGERIKEFIDEFYNDSLVGVLTYKAALRDLRSLIFNHRKGKGTDESNIF